MADSEGSGRKWLTCGCVGCLVAVGVVVLALAVLFGTAKVAVNSEEVQDREVRLEIPRDGNPGRVVLHLSSGEFRLRPADRGEPLHVQARFDRQSYELREQLETREDGWTYELEFERTSHIIMTLLKGVFGGTSSEVDIFLPRDSPIELELWVKQGQAEVELGGLWLTKIKAVFEQGGFELGFDEPLREPVGELLLNGSMGGFQASGLGYASPRRLEVDFTMGGMQLDLRGPWTADSEITVRTNQGGGVIRLPRDVEIVGLETGSADRDAVRETRELTRPTLTFSVSNDRGELEIIE